MWLCAGERLVASIIMVYIYKWILWPQEKEEDEKLLSNKTISKYTDSQYANSE